MSQRVGIKAQAERSCGALFGEFWKILNFQLPRNNNHQTIHQKPTS